MKYIYILLLTVSVSLSSCSNSAVDKINVSITFIPSGGGESGYAIDIKDSIFVVSEKVLDIGDDGFILTSNLATNECVLKDNQVKKIIELLNDIQDFEGRLRDLNQEVTNVWDITICFDGKEAIFVDTLLLIEKEEFKQIKEFIDYIIEISPLDIVMD